MSPIKYKSRLFQVKAGQLITIVGKACNHTEQFDINFGTGLDSENISFNISARFGDEPVIVRNSKNDGNWGDEEISENLFPHNSMNPLVSGGDFKIQVFVDEVAYFLSVNGKPYCTFNHRMPFEDLQFVYLTGDVEAVHQVNQETAQERPWPAANVNCFEATVPSQFNPGSVIVITAKPRGSESGDFVVEFYDGSNKFRRHFQFRAFLDSQIATLDSQDESGNWLGRAEASHPFSITNTFKLAIALTDSEYQVAGNGEIIGALTYADDPDRLFGSLTGISLISNNGCNVQVKAVNYMNLPSDCGGFEGFSIIRGSDE